MPDAIVPKQEPEIICAIAISPDCMLLCYTAALDSKCFVLQHFADVNKSF